MDINVFSINIGSSHTNLHQNIPYDGTISKLHEYGETKHLARSVCVVDIPILNQLSNRFVMHWNVAKHIPAHKYHALISFIFSIITNRIQTHSGTRYI